MPTLAPSKAPITAPNAPTSTDLLALKNLSKEVLYRLLVAQMGKQKLGLNWESSGIDRDAALNADVVLPRVVADLCCTPTELATATQPHYKNLIIEGDNFDSLRLLRSTHAGKIRVIYIDPPYNTGNKDWVYNDRYVGANDRYRHSQWLEFLYRRLSLARELLTPDGVILVSINDESRSRLELLMDEAFPGMKLGSLTWRTRQGSNADQQCFLSVDHEHVLVYGNSGFKFNGFDKTYDMYSNPDNDPRGDWRVGDITLGFSHKERPNLYYPVIDPSTGISYPCSPESVWRYATESRVKDGQQLQAKTMEEFISLNQIIFPTKPRVVVWETMEALIAAIESGDVPKGGKSLLLRKDLPNLDYWVGKPVGFGRPQFKRYKEDLRNSKQPLSSWVVPTFEDGVYEAENSFVSSTNQEGAKLVAEIFGDKAFNYAKPLSLIKGLLAQATRPNDTVLDFFAGSGTTGQAVLELNAEDGGQRRFILCSSTEATDKEPDKNICRDVCAERMRRVIAGVAGHSEYNRAQGGEFAYLQLDKSEPADLLYEAQLEHTALLLSLRRFGVAQDFSPQLSNPSNEAGIVGKALVKEGIVTEAIVKIGRVDDCDILLCPRVTQAVLDQLAVWPAPRIAVYSHRPSAMQRLLHARGVDINCHSIHAALRQAQVKPRKKSKIAIISPVNRSD